MEKIIITGSDLTISDLVAVSRRYAEIELAPEAKERISASRALVEKLAEEKKVVYSVTTGINKYSETALSPEDCCIVQKNLILTHAVGAGDPFRKDAARGIMLLVVKKFSITEYVATATKIVAAMVESL